MGLRSSYTCKSPPRLPGITARMTPSATNHATQWRSLCRDQDPLADPLVLELAEAVESSNAQYATLALCGAWLKSRVGQRFATAAHCTLVSRVIAAPDLRALVTFMNVA